MELCNRVFFTWVVFLLELVCTLSGQQLFSIFTQTLPTHNGDEVSFYSHLSWEQQNMTTCVTPACLRVYKLTNKTAQFFGRMTDYQWVCTQGCVTNDVISDFSKLMLTEVSSYHGNKWESGEELFTYKFKPGTGGNVHLSLQWKNGTVTQTIETMELNIGTRNDTNRANVSPSVAVLPIYQVPLGCTLTIDLSPYDGDGDYTTCTWTNKLQSATLGQTTCKIHLDTSTSSGYVAGQYYHGTVSVEDYSKKAVSITKNGVTSILHGPFSKVPVMFTVYISPALSNKNECRNAPVFEPYTKEGVGSYLYPSSYSSTFTSKENSATMLTVGHLSTVFTRTSNSTSATETAEWVLGMNETGIYRACVMLYNNKGLPGETRCDTLLIDDTDDCAGNNICVDEPNGHCTDYWHHHTCTYDKDKDGHTNTIPNSRYVHVDYTGYTNTNGILNSNRYIQTTTNTKSTPLDQTGHTNTIGISNMIGYTTTTPSTGAKGTSIPYYGYTTSNGISYTNGNTKTSSNTKGTPIAQYGYTKTAENINNSSIYPYDKPETKTELNIGLIAGAAGGGAILLVAMVTGIILYLKYLAKKKQKVRDLTPEKHNQQNNVAIHDI